MKKELKRMVCLVLAVGMMVTSLLIPSTQASAATVDSAVHIGIKSQYSFQIKFDEGDYQIANLSASNANLICRTTYTDSSSNKSSWNQGTISLYAKKKGKYTVNFDVIGHDKAVKSHHTVTVYANDDIPIKKVTFAGKEDNFYRISGKTKGKFKVTMAKGYKLISITMHTYDKNGKSVEKTIKNGKSVKLGKYRYRSEGSKNEYYENWYANLLASTWFEVVYTDKYTKQPRSATYYIYCVPSN